MIDITKVKVGDTVIRKKDGATKTIEHFCHGCVRLINEGGWYRLEELDYVVPPTPPQFKVGDRVKVISRDMPRHGMCGNIAKITGTKITVGFDCGDCVDYLADWLTLIDQPQAKRVEVVTETRTVVKEVVIRLDISMAEGLLSLVDGYEMNSIWRKFADELKSALENANG